MEKIEMRNVKVKYCDYCDKETESLDKCAICKREMCTEPGGAAHSAFSVELYQYLSGKRLAGYGSRICEDCASKKFGGTIQELLSGMMNDQPLTLIPLENTSKD
jgi:hypothetical protein